MKLSGMISGGIDSPVAAHLMMEKNSSIEAIIFDNSPFSSEEELEIAEETIKKLAEIHNKEIKTHIVPSGHIQEKFLNNADEEWIGYSCIFSRRMMLRIAERISRNSGLDGIVTGESLGQVASQTLDNLTVIDRAVKIPIYRPLIGLDKEEIIAVAKNIGTFELSTQGGITCAARVKYPETHAQIEKMKEIERNFKIEELIEKSLNETEEKIIG